MTHVDKFLRSAVLLLLFFLPSLSSAQDLTLKSLTETTDIMFVADQVLDANQDICALIKVFLPIEGAVFVGSVVKQEYRVNEYWVYVPKGRKVIRIQCPGFHTADLYFGQQFPAGLQPKRIYRMELTGYEAVTSQSATRDTIPQDLLDEIIRLSLSDPNSEIDGHEYVDLGLSVKWATCNVGASSPEEYGDYFAWGETKVKKEYNKDNCKVRDKKTFKHGIEGNANLDAARANWGGTWRMPTIVEMMDLVDNCTWTWTNQRGHNGYKVTSKKNGNSIFLPAAGYRHELLLSNTNSSAAYWSSTPFKSKNKSVTAIYFDCDTIYNGAQTQFYFYGNPIRPVTE